MRSLSRLSALTSKMKTYKSKIHIFPFITLDITVCLCLFQNFYFQVCLCLTNENNAYWYFPSAQSVPPSLLETFLQFRCSPVLTSPSSPWSSATSSTAYSPTAGYLCSLNSWNPLRLALLWHLKMFQLQHDMCITEKKKKLAFYEIISKK